MYYKKFYEIVKNGYKRQYENRKASLYNLYDEKVEYFLMAALSKARGPMFREEDEYPIDYLASFEALGESRRFLRDDIYESLKKYPGKDAEYIKLYTSFSNENDKKLFALYVTLLVQFYEQLNKYVVYTPVNESEKLELAAKIMPLTCYINYLDKKWYMYGCTPFWLSCTDINCQTYLLICDVMQKHLAECEVALEKFDTKEKIKKNKTEYSALKQRGDGAVVPQDAMLRNRFCFCGLLGRSKYNVDQSIFPELNAGNFLEILSASGLANSTQLKALDLFLYVMSMFLQRRKEFLLKYDAAQKSGDEKELWVSGIRIEAYNEILNGLGKISEKNGGKAPWQK
ncbi:MAG: hypothetical protein DBX47_06925 [Clostridiales bacterium]|nr:MAG: hypothetical protein DBX47_06925 [Clostridiales bacterium]